MTLALYCGAVVDLLISTAAIYMALLPWFPLSWLRVHYFVRWPAVISIGLGSLAWVLWATWAVGAFPREAILPLCLMGVSVVLTYRMHQETAFRAVDFPPMAADPLRLPIDDRAQLAVIEHGGVTKAYPLDYVIHHHIVNDRFGDELVALTYCAMCRSIIPFNVTVLGPLFVASFKEGNMIVADRRTKTYFQQASFESRLGPLHPTQLTMIPFQILPWQDLKNTLPLPQVVEVSARDFRSFELPIPGVWKRIVATDAVPGLFASERDRTFPSRTPVVGITDPLVTRQVAYLKSELLDAGVVANAALGIVLVAVNDAVNAFRSTLHGRTLELELESRERLRDTRGGGPWNLRGKWVGEGQGADLIPVAISDEYWFAWKRFHPDAELIRLSAGRDL